MKIDLIITFEVAFHPYSCSLKCESTTNFLLHCNHFSDISSPPRNSINEVLGSVTNLNDCTLIKILLFGDQNYTQVENLYIIDATIKHLVDLERFNSSASYV